MRPRAMTWTGRATALVLAACALGAAPARAAAVTVGLCAGTGSLVTPDALPITFWGFALDPTGSGACVATLPGPRIVVNAGDAVTVHFRNTLADRVSVIFPGQDMLPDTTGADGSGGTATYVFTAAGPGTYIYETGTNPAVQLPMGLYGALVVRPAGFAARAYDDPSTAFTREALLMLSEIDPALNASPGSFNLLAYNPDYFLINGKAFPQTPNILARPGETLLLRYVNAASSNHTMTLLGLRQRLIGTDAFPQPFPVDLVAETLPAGQAAEMLVSVPVTAAVGTKFPLYSRQMLVTNGTPGVGNDGTAAPHFPGGMMTMIEVAPPTLLYFSVAGTGSAVTIPGFPASGANSPDDADIFLYNFSTGTFTRVFDARHSPVLPADLPANADIDALKVVDATHFYASFSTDGGTTVPGIGRVDDEDVVYYDNGTWSMYFDGSDVGLGVDAANGASAEDVDAFDILPDGSVVVSTTGTPDLSPALPTTGANAPRSQDLLKCDPANPPSGPPGGFGPTTSCTWSLYFDGSDVALSAGTENIDDVAVVGSDILLSTTGAFSAPATASVTGAGEDVFVCLGATTGTASACSGFSLLFDGSARGITGTTAANANIDAFFVSGFLP